MKDGRGKILIAAYELLCETQHSEKVTVREIAKRAGVGIGLVNYHFSSKDMMLMEAVGVALAQVADRWKEKAFDLNMDPYEQLRQMLYELMEMGAQQLYLIKIAARFELTEGDINTPMYILPYVMRITGCEEDRARMISFSMICNLQSASLRTGAFQQFLGLNVECQEDRQRYINLLMESHLWQKE